MELRKFPVTAPDGTEYRVEIYEIHSALFGTTMDVRVEIPVGRRKFKHVRTFEYRGIVHYDASAPDYVEIAARSVAEYTREVRKISEAAARKQAAVERFNAWDGRIDKLPEVIAHDESGITRGTKPPTSAR